jgi:hypothetical protein
MCACLACLELLTTNRSRRKLKIIHLIAASYTSSRPRRSRLHTDSAGLGCAATFTFQITCVFDRTRDATMIVDPGGTECASPRDPWTFDNADRVIDKVRVRIMSMPRPWPVSGFVNGGRRRCVSSTKPPEQLENLISSRDPGAC